MKRVVVDTIVLSKLDNLSSALELCNEAGATLVTFLPTADRQREVYDWAREASRTRKSNRLAGSREALQPRNSWPD